MNDQLSHTSRSILDIVRANVLTRINAILSVLLIIALVAGSAIDALFGLVIFANSSIGIIQEIRAKRTLDRLAILNETRPIVRRAGLAAAIDQGQVVIDDIIELGVGDQILVDGELVEGSALEVDESLLTGEAEAVGKDVGATLLSGSFVVAGSGAYRATAVGRDRYSARLVHDAQQFILARSELRAGIDRILAFVTVLIIPAGALIVYTQIFASGQQLAPALVGMIAALVPMVPEGLVLMTSIALALGIIRLGRMNCLVQELAAIEILARVDVLCIDKTGTLTESGMTVIDIVASAKADEATARNALASMAKIDPRPNATLLAIKEALVDPGFEEAPIHVVPFSSTRKWQAIEYHGYGAWVLGAPDALLDPASEVARQAEAIAARGLRVLLLGRVDKLPASNSFGQVDPQLLVVLSQRLRPEAQATLEYFASQGVSAKILSGDNVASVQAVARALHLEGSENAVDARGLSGELAELGLALEKSSVFGRVSPEQKRAMILALKARGHTVAMTGDGVNDVLALKLADIGVAMGSGSPATRAVARIVLLDNDFATLPKVVGEGRRVIGNVERIANLFLSKTVYSALLALIVGSWGVAASLLQSDPLPFPFLPRHIMISAWFTIGIPALILSLAATNDRVRTGFVSRVMRLAVPSGVVVSVMTFVCYLLASDSHGLVHASRVQSSTAALICLITIMLSVLSVVARPYEWWKVLLLVVSFTGYLALFGWQWTQRFFLLDPSNLSATGLGLISGLVGAAAVELIWRRARSRKDPIATAKRQ